MAEGTFSHRFTKPGSYDYLCTLHPNMAGTIEVTG
jgi:plastocyanin